MGGLKRSTVLALVALLTSACAPDDPGRVIPPVVWSGDYLDFAPQKGAPEVCSGTLPYMDRTVALVADVMRVELDRPLIYVLGSEREDSLCEQEETLGCAFDDSVYSRVAPQEHEIVHGVRGTQGFSHLFFEEGAAEVFGDDSDLALRVPANGDLMEGIEIANGRDGLPSRWYPRAGHFVAYLHDRYGPAVTTALLQRTDAFSSAEQALEVVEETTGVPFEELRVDYEAQAVCGQADYRYPLYGCEEPTALRERCEGDRAVFINERIACDDPTTIGPRDGQLWKYIAFEVPTDGDYWIWPYSETGAPEATVTVEECSMQCGSIVVEKQMGIELNAEPVFLRAGRYSVRLTRPVELPGEVSLIVRGDDCD